MITLLVGHRGVGKTSLLRRMAHYIPEARFFCLDEEIEKKHGDIKTIFAKQGEAYFRQIEHQKFIDIYNQEKNSKRCFVAIGAGYQREFPKDCHVLWVKRNIDASQFRFLNRPTLSSNPEELKIPKELFEERERLYNQVSDEHFILPEGLYSELESEHAFFTGTIKDLGGALTLLPRHFNKPNYKTWLSQRDQWGLKAFELREDLLSKEQLESILNEDLKTPLIYSLRCETAKIDISEIVKVCDFVDWDINLGEVPQELLTRGYASLHTESSTFLRDLEKVNFYESPLKWSPVVDNFSQLALGHRWMLKSPKTRAFLPRSPSGRWKWYRQIVKNKMMINFLREDEGSSIDQPTLAEWVTVRDSHKCHGAVLGQPVNHSWSPVYHQKFFRSLSANFVAIEISKSEATAKNLQFLWELGFRAFAVTSPLKKWASALTDREESTNTLVWCSQKNRWKGVSTDMLGFEEQLKNSQVNITVLSVVIWGSGSMASEIQKKYSHVQILSARTGEVSLGENLSLPESPDVVIWASGDTGYDLILKMYPDWKPQSIIDLNYREDSPAIEYAFLKNAQYVSGQNMFLAQAQEQQSFWRKELVL